MLNAKIVVHMMALGGTASQFLADPQHVRILLNNNPFLKTIQYIINKKYLKKLNFCDFSSKVCFSQYGPVNIQLSI